METNNLEVQEKKPRSKVHYGWVIVVAGLLITGAGIGIFNSCTGVFIKPVCEALGFARGQFTLYSSISTLVCVVLMPFFGSLFRKFGFRKVAIFGAVVCGMTLIGYSFSSQLWHFYVLAFISGIFVNGVGVMSVGILVNRWFIDKRGLATGIAYSGSGLLAAVLIPITSSFIESNGWQWSYRFLGIVSLVILISIILFVVRDKPEDMGLEPYREKSKTEVETSAQEVESTGLTRQEALKTGAYWLLIIAVFGIALCQAGPHVHTVSFLSDIGYSDTYASSISSVYMLLLTASKIIMGFVFDKLGSLKGSLLIGGCCILFPVFALLAAFPAFPWVYALVLSVASSGSTILGTILTTNYFGRKDFARVYSVISMASYLGVAISSPLLGSIYDLTGGYNIAWIMIIILGLGVCACLTGTYLKSKKLQKTTES